MTSITTYTSNPSREELLILIHLCAAQNLEYCHVDQVRAFLSAERREPTTIYTRVRGSSQYWKIVHALYGLKTSPRDYQETVVAKLLQQGYKRLPMCHSIYIKPTATGNILVYNYVDDFLFAATTVHMIKQEVDIFRLTTNTTEPLFDPPMVLGLHLVRNREKRIILVDMQHQIEKMVEKLGHVTQEKYVPMPTSQYIIDAEELAALPEKSKRQLTSLEITKYLSIVGGINWISGVRMDINFSLLFLAWNTQLPLQHHLNQAYHLLNYLYTTRCIPLVLGGSDDIQITAYSDCSLGTGPKGRSIVGLAMKLHPFSGAISAQSKSTQCVVLNIFEGELDGLAKGIQAVNRVTNTLTEFQIPILTTPILYGDNMAVIDFVHGRGSAKGVRHMALRLWYCREQTLLQHVEVDHMDGEHILADKLTKLGSVEDHNIFVIDLLGLALLGINDIRAYVSSTAM